MDGSFATELNEKQAFVLLHSVFCILSMFNCVYGYM